MANYNKPGVYVEETLTPNIPVNSTLATTVAAFIGVADRGPTQTITYNSAQHVVGAPTLVTSWSQFTNLYEFANAVSPFDASLTASPLGTIGSDLRYAVKSFFDNGGSQAYIVRDLNVDTVPAFVSLRDSNGIVAQGEAWAFDGTDSVNGKIKISSASVAGTPFASKGFEIGRTVSISGVTATGFTVLNGKTWVISDVDTAGNYIKILYKGGAISNSSVTVSTITPTTLTPTVTGVSAASTVIIGASTGVAIGQAITGTGIATPSATISNVASFSTSATPTVGASNVTAISVATTGIQVGMAVSGTGIGAGNTVAAVSATGVTLVSTTIAPVTGGPLTFTGATLTLSAVNAGTVSGSATIYTGTLTYATSNTSGLLANQSITVTGASAPTVGSYNGTFTVASVSNNTNFTITGNYAVGTGTSGTGTFGLSQAYAATAPIVLAGGSASANGTLKLQANSEGIWGNSTWISVSPNTVANTFDVNVFYSLSATTTADLTIANRVESFQQLSMVSSDARYAPKMINAATSNWLVASDIGSALVTATTASATTTNVLTMSSATGIATGQSVTGTNIGANAIVTNVVGNTVTLSVNASGTVASGTAITLAPPTGLADLPALTNYWSTSTTSANVATDGSFTWNTSNVSTGNVSATSVGNQTVANTINAIKLGKPTSDIATYPAVTTLPASNVYTAGATVFNSQAGTAGVTSADFSGETLARLDAITIPLVINYPKKTDSSSVNKLLTYAYTRGDSFIIIDSGASTWGATDSIASILTNAAAYTSRPNYGALYGPNITINDPASTTGGTKVIPAGASVAAVYVNTDASRGVFKAPAGINARITNAIQAYSLTNDEFTLVNNSLPYLNVIRPIGGNFCIMGSRTLNSLTSDKFVPVRRSLNYLGYALKDLTAFAVFEPNDQRLWANVSSIVNTFLYNYWRGGGLAGETAEAAFYVKCDADVNTPSVVNSGELRIEVGVALQQPAEFVVIRIGQINGGSTVTTSV